MILNLEFLSILMTPLFLLLAFLSEVFGTVAGFGSSTVLMPLALFFFDFRTALVVVAFFHLFGNIGRVSFFRQGLNKRLLLTFGVPGVVMTMLGALLVSYASQELLKIALGIFLVLFSVVSLLKFDFKAKMSNFNSILGGGISGFLAGLIGTGGALRGAFLTSFGLKKKEYLATAAVMALAVDATRIPVYLAGGFHSQQIYWYLPLLFIIAVLGSFAGKKVVERFSQSSFKRFVLGAIFLAGLKLAYDGTALLLR